MKPLAHEHMIIGALCIDEDFRNQVFEVPETGSSESQEQRVVRLLREYGETNDVAVDASVAPKVLNVVRGSCRDAALKAYEGVKTAACPCWPC